MEAEVRIVAFDWVTAVLSIAGAVCFVGGAVMRMRGGQRWDRVFLAGAVLIAAAVVYTFAATWLRGVG